MGFAELMLQTHEVVSVLQHSTVVGSRFYRGVSCWWHLLISVCTTFLVPGSR